MEGVLVAGFVLVSIGVVIVQRVSWRKQRVSWRKRKIRRRLRALPATPIGRVRGGLTKITGRLRTIDKLTAPLSRLNCAAYESWVCHVEEGSNNKWVRREVEVEDFLIDDGTGVARVEGAGAELAITSEDRWFGGPLDDATPERRAFILQHGGWDKFREGVLANGAEVTVVGEAEQELDPTPGATSGYREPPMRWVIRAGKHGLFVSDAPRD